MPVPTPHPGLVISYSYLWVGEHSHGAEEGRKDRPCAIVLRRQMRRGRFDRQRRPHHPYAARRSRRRRCYAARLKASSRPGRQSLVDRNIGAERFCLARPGYCAPFLERPAVSIMGFCRRAFFRKLQEAIFDRLRMKKLASCRRHNPVRRQSASSDGVPQQIAQTACWLLSRA